MSSRPQADVHQLAEQLSEGFEALSGEYQLLLAQQRQLESKLSWAKQQVCAGSSLRIRLLPFHDEKSLALDLQSLATLTDNLLPLSEARPLCSKFPLLLHITRADRLQSI